MVALTQILALFLALLLARDDALYGSVERWKILGSLCLAFIGTLLAQRLDAYVFLLAIIVFIIACAQERFGMTGKADTLTLLPLIILNPFYDALNLLNFAWCFSYLFRKLGVTQKINGKTPFIPFLAAAQLAVILFNLDLTNLSKLVKT